MVNLHPYHIRGEINLIRTESDKMENIVDGISFYQLSDNEFSSAIKEISLKLQSYLLSSNLSIFVGSGCSSDAIPLMGSTFNLIKQELEEKELLGEYLDINNNKIEDCLNWLNSGLQFLKKEDPLYASYDGLYNAIISKLKDSIVNIDKGKSEGVLSDYSNFLNYLLNLRKESQYNPLNLFTTNYDMFLERAMEKCGIHYTNGFNGIVEREFDPSVFRLRYVDDENRYKDKWDPVSRFARLYKLHGSLSWFFEGHKVVEKMGYSTDYNQENTVIYPTVNKHTQSLQTPYSELFREFSMHLQKPNTTLLVMGYGFPDDHINQLMQQALSNETFTLIILGNITELGLKNFYSRNKNKTNLHIIGGNTTDGSKVHYFSYLLNNIFDTEKVDLNV